MIHTSESLLGPWLPTWPKSRDMVDGEEFNMPNQMVEQDWFKVSSKGGRLQAVRHRVDAPSMVYSQGLPTKSYNYGRKCWFVNGKRHREDGPAVEYPTPGDRRESYWISGKRYTTRMAWEEECVRQGLGQGRESLLEL